MPKFKAGDIVTSIDGDSNGFGEVQDTNWNVKIAFPNEKVIIACEDYYRKATASEIENNVTPRGDNLVY